MQPIKSCKQYCLAGGAMHGEITSAQTVKLSKNPLLIHNFKIQKVDIFSVLFHAIILLFSIFKA